MSETQLASFLNKSFENKDKQALMQEYIPLIMLNEKMKKDMSSVQRKLGIYSPFTNSEYSDSLNQLNALNALGIVIPPNMLTKKEKRTKQIKSLETEKLKFESNQLFNAIDDPATSSISSLKTIESSRISQPEVSNSQLNFKLDFVFQGEHFENPCMCYPYDVEEIEEKESGSMIDYNVLNPEFGHNAFLFEPEYVILYVLLHSKALQTVVVKNPNKDALAIIEKHAEFGFIKLVALKTNNKDIIKNIEDTYNGKLFFDTNDLNLTLQITSQIIGNSSNLTTCVEKQLLRRFVSNCVTVTNDDNHSVQANELHATVFKNMEEMSELIASNNVKLSEWKPDNSKTFLEQIKMLRFRNRVSSYLKGLGLQLKHHEDGFYYHGLILNKNKVNNFVDQRVAENMEIDIQLFELHEANRKRELDEYITEFSRRTIGI
jgi:hypothetical protein